MKGPQSFQICGKLCKTFFFRNYECQPELNFHPSLLFAGKTLANESGSTLTQDTCLARKYQTKVYVTDTFNVCSSRPFQASLMFAEANHIEQISGRLLPYSQTMYQTGNTYKDKHSDLLGSFVSSKSNVCRNIP